MTEHWADTDRGGADFTTTQWSVVLEAMHADPDKARIALQKLCSRYWYPVYAFVRRKGHDTQEAEDLTQGFFEFVLERQAFQAVDPEKGRFRSFLLAALTNYLHNEHDRQRTHKRGGRHEIVSIHEGLAEEIYGAEPHHGLPERDFDRSWAATLVRRVLDELRSEHESRGKAALFTALQPLLTGEAPPGAYEQIGKQLGMESGAVKVALHRARRRFGELLRREVAHTVERPEDVESELRALLSTMAGQFDA